MLSIAQQLAALRAMSGNSTSEKPAPKSFSAEPFLTPQAVADLAQAVHKRLDAFNGNCGVFAVALHQYLTEHGMAVGIVYVENDEEEGIGHAAIKVDRKIIDGSGVISLKKLKQFGLYDHGSTLDEVSVTDISPEAVTGAELRYVVRHTDSEDDVSDFLLLIAEEAERMGYTTKKELKAA